jgi:metal-sulfur cluster biosynthetic enzyme
MENEVELWTALRQVYDPKVGISIVDLGLIYRVVQRDDCAYVEMRLTAPGCPLHGTIGQAVQRAGARAQRRPHGGRAGLGRLGSR